MNKSIVDQACTQVAFCDLAIVDVIGSSTTGLYYVKRKSQGPVCVSENRVPMSQCEQRLNERCHFH